MFANHIFGIVGVTECFSKRAGTRQNKALPGKKRNP